MNKFQNVVSNGSKILIWKQITTKSRSHRLGSCCFQWFKDTNLKANHNALLLGLYLGLVVSNGSKILIWKQITTVLLASCFMECCFQWFKDTNLKANHNYRRYAFRLHPVVSNGSKILIWKQITTPPAIHFLKWSCFQWFKDTNLKANHNFTTSGLRRWKVVSNGSKILIWKQITTHFLLVIILLQLFPMVQRY